MNDVAKILQGRIAEGKKTIAVLIDPDKTRGNLLEDLLLKVNRHAQLILVGGSFVQQEDLENCLAEIRLHSTLPICIFPGHATQVSEQADAILFLNLVSGRNPDFLIGNQMLAAPAIARSGIQVLPTAYMLIESGSVTAAQYMSNTQPIPSHQSGIAVATALAAKFMGQQYVYLDAGSGALESVPPSMVEEVKTQVGLPLIVGGGIRSKEQASAAFKAGADMVVVGNGVERRNSLLTEIATLL